MPASSTTRTIVGAAATTTLAALPVFLLSTQAVLVRDDLGFDERGLGLGVGAFFAASAIGALIAGALLETRGGRAQAITAGGLAVVSSAAAALATSYPMLVVALILCGFANAALQTSANLSLAYAVPHHRRGLGFGIKQSAAPAAILLGGLAVPTIGLMVGWRWTYAILAGLAVVVIVRGVLSSMPAPQRRAGPDTGERAPLAGLLVTGFAVTLASGSVTAMGAFLPLWSVEVGLTAGTAGYVLAVSSLLCVIARVVGGYLADRRGGGGNLRVVASMMASGAVGLALIANDTLPMLVAGALVTFAIGWAWPGLIMFALVRIGRERPGNSTSTVQAGAFLGGALGPMAFGVIVHAASFPVAWYCGAAAMASASGLVLMGRRIFVKDFARRPW